MPINTAQVRAGLDGGVYVAPLGTVIPITATAALDPAYVHLGYFNDDGVEIDPSQDREEFTAWQSVVPVRRVLTGSQFNLTFTMIQTTRLSLELYFPNAFTTTTGGDNTLTIPANPSSDVRIFLFDWLDGSIANRIVLQRGEVIDVDSLQIQRGAPAAYQVTITAYPVSNVIASWLSNDPALAA